LLAAAEVDVKDGSVRNARDFMKEFKESAKIPG